MIYFYVSAIFLVALGICLFFAIRKDRQDGKISDEKFVEETKEEKKEEEKSLESFTLDKEKEEEKSESEENTDVEEEDDEAETKSFEESFAEYERFLKENNINLDDLEDDEEEAQDEADEKDIKTVDLKVFEGKTRNEIMEMLSNYTEEEQKMILEELLSKKED